MEVVAKTLSYLGNLIFTIVLTILFVPSFLIVTYLQPVWAKKIGEVFHI